MADKVPSAAGGGPMLVKPSTWEALRRRVENLETVPDPLEFETTRRDGKLFFRTRPKPTDPGHPGGGSSRPFELRGGIPSECGILESTLAGATPGDFTDGFMALALSGDGYVFAKLTIDGETGAVTARELITGTSSSIDDTDTEFHTAIGGYSTTDEVVTVWNLRYGPIDATICRNWFATAAPYYSVSFFGS